MDEVKQWKDVCPGRVCHHRSKSFFLSFRVCVQSKVSHQQTGLLQQCPRSDISLDLGRIPCVSNSLRCQKCPDTPPPHTQEETVRHFEGSSASESSLTSSHKYDRQPEITVWFNFHWALLWKCTSWAVSSALFSTHLWSYVFQRLPHPVLAKSSAMKMFGKVQTMPE